jgi:hypothetical protein
MKNVLAVMTWMARCIQVLGPYFLLELLLPGGTLMALLLWQWRRSHRVN